jgi:putative endonuclease
MKEKVWYVYIIQNLKGYLYTGITTDINRRFKEHAETSKGAKFFRVAPPSRLVFSKTFPNRSLASKFEYQIKSLSRAEKLKLIRTNIS